MNAYEKLCIARSKERPTAVKFIENIFENFYELHGDQLYGDDKAIVAGIATIKGMPVTVIGIEKGSDTKDKVLRNFGCAHPEGYRKAMRLMREAEKFNRPVVCIVDTSGAYCGIDAEERGQGSAIAKNLLGMMGLKTPVISIIIGEGGSGGALALSVADEVWMLENSVYSVISPEGAASIIWKDSSKAQEASNALKITAQDLLSFNVIERIFPENGADFEPVYTSLKEALVKTLKRYKRLKTSKLLERRYERFRKIGGLNT